MHTPDPIQIRPVNPGDKKFLQESADIRCREIPCLFRGLQRVKPSITHEPEIIAHGHDAVMTLQGNA